VERVGQTHCDRRAHGRVGVMARPLIASGTTPHCRFPRVVTPRVQKRVHGGFNPARRTRKAWILQACFGFRVITRNEGSAVRIRASALPDLQGFLRA
jgi:hypothetical protein